MAPKVTNRIALAVMVVGLLLGPGYLAYCWFLSGSTVGTHQLSTKHPLTLHLSSEMSPIRFLVVPTFAFDSPAQERREGRYLAVLARDAEPIWEEHISVTPPARKGGTADKGSRIRFLPKSAQLQSPLRTFSVDRAGDFTLTVRDESIRPVRGVKLVLHIRRNVASANLAIVIPGFLIMLIGAFLRLASKQARSGRKRGAASARPKSSKTGRDPQAAPPSRPESAPE